MLEWYDKIINFLIEFIVVSIHDSDVSDFYKYIIAFKNLMRSIEFSRKSGVFGMRQIKH